MLSAKHFSMADKKMALPDLQIFNLKFLITVFLLFLLSACLSSDWKEAKQRDSVASYEAFIKKYPESEGAKEAKERVELLEWDNAKEINTKRSYYQFIAEYTDSEMASVAKRHIVDLEWLEVKRQDQINIYKSFVKSYPKSNHAKNAKERIMELDWEETKRKNRLSAYQQFVSIYQNTPYTKKAEIEIKKMEIIEKEFGLYKRAKKLNTLNGYTDYLALYPKGKYSNKVQYRLLSKLPAKFVKTARGLFSEDIQQREESISALYDHDPRDVSSILVILLGLIPDEKPDVFDDGSSDDEQMNHLDELQKLFGSMNDYAVPNLIDLLNNQNLLLNTRKKIINILVYLYDSRAVTPFSRILNTYDTDCILRLHLIKAMVSRD